MILIEPGDLADISVEGSYRLRGDILLKRLLYGDLVIFFAIKETNSIRAHERKRRFIALIKETNCTKNTSNEKKLSKLKAYMYLNLYGGLNKGESHFSNKQSLRIMLPYLLDEPNIIIDIYDFHYFDFRGGK